MPQAAETKKKEGPPPPAPPPPPPPPPSPPSPLSPEQPYDLFENRKVRKPNSDFGTAVHVLKTSFGSGILAMPMAFKNSGLVFGFFGTIFVGLICAHCVEMLVRSEQTLCKTLRIPKLSYPETAQKAFEKGPKTAKKWAKAIGIIIVIELLGSFILGNTVYVVIISETLYQIFEFYWDPHINIRLYIIFLWIPLILMCLVRTLKSLVPFSVIANIFVFISFGIVLYYIFRDIQSPKNVYFVAPYDRIPLFLSTVIFSIEGIGTILSIEQEMRHPEHFIGGRCGILYIAMSIVLFVYTFVGFFGYLQYGEDTRGSVTLNLPSGDWLAQIVKLLIALAVFFTYTLQFYVPINMILDLVLPKVSDKYKCITDLAVRAGLVTLTIIGALVIPNLEKIISLVGAICFCTLGLTLPALIDTMTRYPDFGCRKWRLYKNIGIVILSVFSVISGTYASLLEIIDSSKLK